MKKFFTLCAAFAMLMSVDAAPQLVKGPKTADLKPAHHLLTGRAPQKPAAPMKAAKQSDRKVAANGLRRAKAQVLECSYDAFTAEDYGTDTWFQCTTSDGVYKFAFNPLAPMSDLEIGHVYTMDEMWYDYTYVQTVSPYTVSFMAETAFVLSYTEDGKMVFDCECTDENGQQYHVFYKPLERPETYTEVELGEFTTLLKDFTATQGAFQFTGENEEYNFAVCIASDGQIEGSYTSENLYGELNYYTYLSAGGGYVEKKLCDAELNVVSLGAHNYHIDVKLYSYDGNVYVGSGDYIEPTADNKVTITATNLEIDVADWDFYMEYLGYGMADFSASNGEYKLGGTLQSYSTVEGQYNDGDHILYSFSLMDAEDNIINKFSNDLVVEKDGDAFTLKGTVLCWNNTEYTLDLCFQIPEITGESLYLSNEGLLNDLVADMGVFQIMAEDANGDYFSVVLDANEIVSGHYTSVSKDYKAYSYIQVGEEFNRIYTADFDLEWDGETFSLIGTCQAGTTLFNVEIEGVEYIELDPYDATAEDGDIDVTFELDEIVDLEFDGNGFYIDVENMERGDAWACYIFTEGETLEAGEYPINESYEAGSVQAGFCDGWSIYPTIYLTLDEEGYVNVPMWYCSAGTVTISYDAEGNIVLVCDAVNTNGVNVHVVVNEMGLVGIQNVATQALKDGKFFEQNSVVIRNNGNEYNAYGQLKK